MRTISELAPNIEYVSRFDEELGALLGGELRRQRRSYGIHFPAAALCSRSFTNWPHSRSARKTRAVSAAKGKLIIDTVYHPPPSSE